MNNITVLSCFKEKNYYKIIVEENIFYPDGKGGQLGDRGFIGDVKIEEVLDDNIIFVEKEISLGVHNYTIDLKRQLDIAVQHTAQHLFSAIAFNDYELNTVGFRMTETYSTVDLDITLISSEVIFELEKKVNDFITNGSHILVSVLPMDEANELTTLRKKISSKIKEDVRIIEIEGIDVSACAGYHVENIKDIKVFKIVGWEKVKGSYTRFYFLSGDRAILDYNEKNSTIKTLNHMFSCQDYEVLSMVNKSLSENKRLEQELKSVTLEFTNVLFEKLISNPIFMSDISVIVYYGKLGVINNLVSKIDISKYVFIGLTDETALISSNLIDCKSFVNYICSLNNNIKGGGNSTRGNIKGTIKESYILDVLENFLKL
ncbi:MAG: alanyl-tRNA editing protein [Cetobacterium sp.]|uniref:alanyl-tRNA editing protein n=1 Tax=unclassified Cetobacterium TaxID=2630983 RepID=UPI00163C7895|nr:alanyl-tRNA editing protein [Cetobacterium sp. 2A]MBC2856757.1 alanyl-tRNA editing protein [Cetobacterium sp. 2A]